MELLAEVRKDPDGAYQRLMEQVDKTCGRELYLQLDWAVDLKISAAEVKTIGAHGETIMAAIRGDLIAWPGSEPYWRNEPEETTERVDALETRVDTVIERFEQLIDRTEGLTPEQRDRLVGQRRNHDRCQVA